MGVTRSDAELLQDAGAADVDALEALYTRHGSVVYALALRITGNREVAEDVVQETFVSAWRGAATFRPERGNARSWLLGITHHRAIDAVRGRAARAHTELLDEHQQIAGRDDIWSEVQQALDRAAIRAAMASLPAEQRECIELAYFEGYAYPEIADRLAVPLGTVKSRLRLGLGKLRLVMLEASPAQQEGA